MNLRVARKIKKRFATQVGWLNAYAAWYDPPSDWHVSLFLKVEGDAFRDVSAAVPVARRAPPPRRLRAARTPWYRLNNAGRRLSPADRGAVNVLIRTWNQQGARIDAAPKGGSANLSVFVEEAFAVWAADRMTP